MYNYFVFYKQNFEKYNFIMTELGVSDDSMPCQPNYILQTINVKLIFPYNYKSDGKQSMVADC